MVQSRLSEEIDRLVSGMESGFSEEGIRQGPSPGPRTVPPASEALHLLEWHEEAGCRGSDPDLFFPGVGDSAARARRVCERCPVQADCLEHAYATPELYGIWGGKTEKERRSGRKKWLAERRRQARS